MSEFFYKSPIEVFGASQEPAERSDVGLCSAVMAMLTLSKRCLSFT